ncbi:MAG: hypothetical protein ACFB12_27375 [Leptolyngbyaceae cyanobacterium]
MSSLTFLTNTLFGLFLALGIISFHHITKYLFYPFFDIFQALQFFREQKGLSFAAIAFLLIPFWAYFLLAFFCIFARAALMELSSFGVAYICLFPTSIACLLYFVSLLSAPIDLSVGSMKISERELFAQMSPSLFSQSFVLILGGFAALWISLLWA